MKNVKRKILFYLIAIWVISAVYTTIAHGPTKNEIRYEEETSVFELLMDTITPSSSLRLRSKSAILINLESGEVLAKKNENKVRSIASLTKLATAIVYLKTEPDMFKVITITREDRMGGGSTRLYAGVKLTTYDLFHIMLMSSDNVAARAIARSTGFNEKDFIEKMNELALSYNLNKTRFVETTGLDPGNISTASECVILFKKALEYELIAEILSKRNHPYRALNNDRRHIAYNTNRMLYREDVFGGNTGYIRNSGYCLALGIEKSGEKLAAVVLGAPSNGRRYRDAARLLAYSGT
jgi:D-alanyl-D-alanine endopeptidase (penicillin-binding protein 7)